MHYDPLDALIDHLEQAVPPTSPMSTLLGKKSLLELQLETREILRRWRAKRWEKDSSQAGERLTIGSGPSHCAPDAKPDEG